VVVLGLTLTTVLGRWPGTEWITVATLVAVGLSAPLLAGVWTYLTVRYVRTRVGKPGCCGCCGFELGSFSSTTCVVCGARLGPRAPTPPSSEMHLKTRMR
jgi:hypothetical protein